MQTGFVISVSHLGWLTVPVHPPLQLTPALHFTVADVSILHLPLHLPSHFDEHLPWHMALG